MKKPTIKQTVEEVFEGFQIVWYSVFYPNGKLCLITSDKDEAQAKYKELAG